ncbi:hypothetical protein G7046_g6772 [Stylonectria norvegica]|nr:hypothetical protein G7046_g6772 [Stylonectria norvegica]
MWFFVPSCILIAAVLYSLYQCGIPGYAKPEPAEEFMRRICPLQWAVYHESKRHVTLYHFLGLDISPTRGEIITAYQTKMTTLGKEANPCFESLYEDSGEMKTTRVPEVCRSEAFTKVDDRMRLFTAAALILLEDSDLRQYESQILRPMLKAHLGEVRIANQKDSYKWKKEMDNMDRWQAEVDKALLRLCQEYI